MPSAESCLWTGRSCQRRRLRNYRAKTSLLMPTRCWGTLAVSSNRFSGGWRKPSSRPTKGISKIRSRWNERKREG